MASEGDNEELIHLDSCKKAVEDLYHYRDHYFESHSFENAKNKNQDVQKELEKVLDILKNEQDAIEKKAEFMMLKGKALNVTREYSKEACELLQKSVKLDPGLEEGWLQLGECHFKNNDVENARICFEKLTKSSKEKKKSKEALRNLSMVMRQVYKTPEEQITNIEESLKMAKEAVALDITDGTSWFVLGNAYLSSFFATTQSPKIMKQCLSAYQQATKDKVASCRADFYFNRATALKYNEDYEMALNDFARAALLDPSSEEASYKGEKLFDYLGLVQVLVTSKGRLKDKKIKSLVKHMKPSDFGPYSSPHVLKNGQHIKFEPVVFSSLKPEINNEVVVLGKVVCTVVTEEAVPFTFCMIDKEETCVSVTVYNVVLGYGVKIGDSVAIPEPFVQNVDVTYKGNEFKFTNIRVDSPLVMVVNGRKLGIEKQAPTELSVKAMSD